MMKFYCDMHPEINLDIVDLTFPCSHEDIVRKAEEAITKWNEPAITNYTGQPTPTGKTPDANVRIVIVDSIASNPGYVPPPPIQRVAVDDQDGASLGEGRRGVS